MLLEKSAEEFQSLIATLATCAPLLFSDYKTLVSIAHSYSSNPQKGVILDGRGPIVSIAHSYSSNTLTPGIPGVSGRLFQSLIATLATRKSLACLVCSKLFQSLIATLATSPSVIKAVKRYAFQSLIATLATR